MQRYYDYGTYLKQKYGQKVYKLPVNLPVSCPNRDGRRAHGGCTFCAAVGAGFESLDQSIPVRQQLQRNRDYMGKTYHAQKFIAYLQNFSNTYLPVQDFEQVLSDCVADDIVEISISTRPDCIHPAYLDITQKIHDTYGIQITYELGLQSVNTQTLRKINRGHTLAEYIGAVQKIKSYGFGVCTHLIPNLPYDEDEDLIEAAQLLSVLKTDTVKLHNLFLIERTPMAQAYQQNQFQICTMEQYFARVALFLQYLSPNIAVERFFARCPEEGCVFSNWGRSWRFLQNELMTYFFQHDIVQGSLCHTYLDGILFDHSNTPPESL